MSFFMKHTGKILKNKYINGAAKIILSSLSSNPPCPGIIIPLSLTLACRLNFDSIKSPKVPKTLIIILKISQFVNV